MLRLDGSMLFGLIHSLFLGFERFSLKDLIASAKYPRCHKATHLILQMNE